MLWNSSNKLLLVLAGLLACGGKIISAEQMYADMLLSPTGGEIHYVHSYIRGPGHVDLSQVLFLAISGSNYDMTLNDDAPLDDDDGNVDDGEYVADDDEEMNGMDDGAEEDDDDGAEEDDDDGAEEDDDGELMNEDDMADDDGLGEADDGSFGEGDDGSEPSDDGAGDDGVMEGDDGIEEPPVRRRLEEAADGTEVDVVVFSLPKECHGKAAGCDLSQVGVGTQSKEAGGSVFCCSSEAIQLGLCTEYGRLIIDSNKFTGDHQTIHVPNEGEITDTIAASTNGNIDVHDSGWYMVAVVNCNQLGRQVRVSGEITFKSKHGYLPGELFGFMYFYMFLTIAYFALCSWFGMSMRKNAKSRIPIEKWIFLTIVLGLVETFFKTSDYFVWNLDGDKNLAYTFTGRIAGVFKQTFARCLLVMVSLGWGVIRDSLGSTMKSIIILGLVYVAILMTMEVLLIYAVAQFQVLTPDQTENIVNVVEFLPIVAFFVDVIYVFWILSGMNSTMDFLEKNGQSRKLQRYLRLRCIIMVSIIVAFIGTVIATASKLSDNMVVQEENYWMVVAFNDLNFLYVLTAVAILWRPSPNAKEYAYVMELPAQEGEHELELSGVVPSAMEDDYDDDDGYVGSKGYHDVRFQIEDAEHA